MTYNEKEMIAEIKISIIRGIINMSDETLLNLVKKVMKDVEQNVF